MRRFTFAIFFSLCGCGVTQHFVPPVPVQPGHWETRVSIGLSSNRFSRFSLQVGGFYGASNTDAIGIALSGFLIPSSVSYVHYWPSSHFNTQLHVNDLVGANYNPTFQANVSYAKPSGSNFHSAFLGIGYYSTPLLHAAFGNRVTDGAFVPIAGYQFRGVRALGEIQLTHGLSEYFLRYYKHNLLIRPSVNSPEKRSQDILLPRTDVRSIARLDSSEGISGWLVTRTNDSLVVIANRDPYADCIGCGLDESHLGAYTASDQHKIYWVWEAKGHWRAATNLRLMELDMHEALRRFEGGGNLNIVQDADVYERSRMQIVPILHDLSVGIGQWSR